MNPITELKDYLRFGLIHRWVHRRRDASLVAAWEAAGRPQPPPQVVKHAVIRAMAKRFGTTLLVETGTLFGDTIAAVHGEFETIYSIELMDEFYERARRRFTRLQKVRLRHGNSARELPRVLEELTAPAVFWLDAHYSGDGTARAAEDTPISEELLAISRHRIKNHVVLIDDAREFVGTNAYPTIDVCRQTAATFWPQHSFDVSDDIIRIVPQSPR